MIGCGQPETAAPRKPPSEKTLLIGLTPEHNIFKQVWRYEPLADYLSGKTGIRVKLKVLTYRGNVIDNFQFLKLDGTFWGSPCTAGTCAARTSPQALGPS